jgi:hypothetical protein
MGRFGELERAELMPRPADREPAKAAGPAPVDDDGTEVCLALCKKLLEELAAEAEAKPR